GPGTEPGSVPAPPIGGLDGPQQLRQLTHRQLGDKPRHQVVKVVPLEPHRLALVHRGQAEVAEVRGQVVQAGPDMALLIDIAAYAHIDLRHQGFSPRSIISPTSDRKSTRLNSS